MMNLSSAEITHALGGTRRESRDHELPLLEQHWEFLRARAVADDVARQRGYLSATKKSELERLGFGRTQQLVPALVIPIWSVRGAIETLPTSTGPAPAKRQGQVAQVRDEGGWQDATRCSSAPDPPARRWQGSAHRRSSRACFNYGRRPEGRRGRLDWPLLRRIARRLELSRLERCRRQDAL